MSMLLLDGNCLGLRLLRIRLLRMYGCMTSGEAEFIELPGPARNGQDKDTVNMCTNHSSAYLVKAS